MSLISKRNRADKILQNLGLGAIILSFAFMLLLLGSIVIKAIPAFTAYKIKVDFPENVSASIYSDVNETTKYLKNYFKSENGKLDYLFNEYAVEEVASLSKKKELKRSIFLPVSNKITNFLSGSRNDEYVEEEKVFIKKLKSDHILQKKFNYNFFFGKESRNPEVAGIATSVIGSIYTIMVCLLFSFPIAVAAAIYLEEYAPKNLFTSLIEININNLAAVPSIVFGLLGLAVLINFFGLPRSTPIVAGITLAMMIMPIMIISTRQALLTIPSSIKQAALALGATKMQIIMHHSLPLALPGIMTGAILSIGRAFGETAPLILVGMIAFIVDIPHSVFDPATVMPIQIFLWTENPENEFQAKTAAAILIMLCILVIITTIAVYIRKKYEHKW